MNRCRNGLNADTKRDCPQFKRGFRPPIDGCEYGFNSNGSRSSEVIGGLGVNVDMKDARIVTTKNMHTIFDGYQVQWSLFIGVRTVAYSDSLRRLVGGVS